MYFFASSNAKAMGLSIILWIKIYTLIFFYDYKNSLSRPKKKSAWIRDYSRLEPTCQYSIKKVNSTLPHGTML